MRWIYTFRDGWKGTVWAETEAAAREALVVYDFPPDGELAADPNGSSVLGSSFRSFLDGLVYLCVAHDPRRGLWMQRMDKTGKARNISERAIGRTYHRVA